jgi:integrase
VRQQKTGAMLAIPLHPALAAIIEGTPSDHLTFLTTTFGKPFTAPGFGNWFREQCDAAFLPKHCAAHGLRKAAGRRLAEAGCSANVIASILGHTTLTEVARYTKAADQERLAREGMATITRTNPGNGTGTVVKKA